MERTGWQRTWVRAATTVLTLAVMALIYCFSMEGAETSDRTSGWFSMPVIRLLHPDYDRLPAETRQEIWDRVQHAVRKAAHLTEYTVLGFMMRLCLESWFGHRLRRRGLPTLITAALGCGYAVTDELHQLRIEGRFGQWTDVLVDGCGVIAGAALGALWIRCLDRKKAAGK